MKKIYNYMMLLALAFVAVCCNEEDLEASSTNQKGGEVQFGLSLNDNGSRTIYGTETNNAFPVYWSEDDKVLIASPQCARQSAEYVVTPVAGQSYAEALTRTADYGVQWGSSEKADFYSVYPSAGASWTSLTESSVKAELNIASEQSANLVYANNVYNAADMDNVIMYARTAGVTNGDVVNLQYIPYSTTLEFEVTIGPYGENKVYGSAKVVAMTLTAPTDINITGNFTFDFNNGGTPVITAAGSNGNKITMDFTTHPMIDKDNSLRAKFSLIPLSGINSLEGWKVAVTVLEGTDTTTKTYTKTLTKTSALAPGKVHKIKLPALTPSAAWTYNKSYWITSLYDYKNIYLTELSLPGAWYAGAPTDDGYQATESITDLWNAGVRAFAVECRTSTSGRYSSTPEAVVISGTGNNPASYLGAYYYGGTKLRTVIANIASAININEFAVLVLSYADGGTGGHRDEDHNYFINGIKTEIANSGVTNIYSSEINSNTTINDVLGQLIIKINVDDNLTKSSYDDSMNALISYNPFLKDLGSDYYFTPLFSKLYWKTWADTYKTTIDNNTTDFLWCFSSANRTAVSSETVDTSLPIPTYAERQEALRTMITHSKEISRSGTHNVWFYFNAGGTQTTSQEDKSTSATSFASAMNPWLLEVINLKSNGGTDTNGYYTGTAGTYVESNPSSLGLVFFNQCTGNNDTYKGTDIIDAIIEMNNKFKLQRSTDARSVSYDSYSTYGGDVIELN
ncbi:MAG: hypothetical protein IJZ45_11480 [Bacteroidaceae bacterium]|nr:hypothetical protein [Bacteroidaceae bacterium]